MIAAITEIKANTTKKSNEIFYIIKSGCQWRILPKDFPPYSTVHSFIDDVGLRGYGKK
ncbi:transposase [Holospora undulata]|uniref:transposase n=1 Tax=Holospora undulata TaxID=1169117 RepID=UPI00032FAA4B